MNSPIHIVERARQDMRWAIEAGAKADLPDPGTRWGAYSLQTRAASQHFKTPLEVIHYAQLLQGSFESRHAEAELADYAQMFQGMLIEEFPEFSEHLSSFAETSSSLPSTLVELDGRLVSSPVLSHTYNILRCLAHVRPQAVLDIGGGTGSAGRLWATNLIHRPAVYVDLDLPESLFFSEVYLKTLLLDGDVTYVHDGSDLDSIAGAVRASQDNRVSRIFLVPVHNHHFIREIALDLAVNTGSLQEMPAPYVGFYMELIDASTARYFYSSNYFAQRIELLLESMNFAAPVMGPDWKSVFRKWHPDPVRGVAEVLFERRAGNVQIESEAARLLQDIRIDSGAAFLEVFDVIRQVQNPDMLMAAATNARNEMGYTPKEALWLVRRALELSPESEAIRAGLAEMEKLARSGQRARGFLPGRLRSLVGKLWPRARYS
jgi:putative sugar O-methyltransferase